MIGVKKRIIDKRMQKYDPDHIFPGRLRAFSRSGGRDA